MAIAKEHMGHEEFVRDWWPAPAELYFDTPASTQDAPIFRACNGRSMGLSGVGSYLVGGAVKQNVLRVDKAGKSTCTTGAGKVLFAIAIAIVY